VYRSKLGLVTTMEATAFIGATTWSITAIAIWPLDRLVEYQQALAKAAQVADAQQEQGQNSLQFDRHSAMSST